jgi:hypothetical protein
MGYFILQLRRGRRQITVVVAERVVDGPRRCEGDGDERVPLVGIGGRQLPSHVRTSLAAQGRADVLLKGWPVMFGDPTGADRVDDDLCFFVGHCGARGEPHHAQVGQLPHDSVGVLVKVLVEGDAGLEDLARRL